VRAELHDPLLVLTSFGAVAVLVLATRATLRRAPDARFAVRKALHVAVGLWTVAASALFRHVEWALVPPAAFLLANVTGRPKALALKLGEGRREMLGLWMFPAGVILLYLLFWNDLHRGPLLSGAVALAIADPAAALVGSRYGQRRFVGFGFGRSLEGTLIFLLSAGLLCAGVAMAVGEGVSPVRIAVGCGVAGAVAEVLSPAGLDNVTVPLAVAASYAALA
jgi:phytol kinase